ncbi:hypothetical protein [Azospirillum sp.]|uniref:hypothetical protein n=1 Tax=Azospirillum sp. TaxID=34012 RepID=UPI003D737C22
MDYSKILERPEAWGFAGLAVSQLVTLLLGRRKAAAEARKTLLEASTEAKRAEAIDRDAAFKEMMEVVKTLRQDVTELRNRLDDEREMRKRLRDELDQERELRLKAETEVRELGEKLQRLQNELQRRGVNIALTAMGDPDSV